MNAETTPIAVNPRDIIDQSLTKLCDLHTAISTSASGQFLACGELETLATIHNDLVRAWQMLTPAPAPQLRDSTGKPYGRHHWRQLALEEAACLCESPDKWLTMGRTLAYAIRELKDGPAQDARPHLSDIEHPMQHAQPDEPANPPLIQQDELPPLPAPTRRAYGLWYSADEMDAYARTAIAASAGQGAKAGRFDVQSIDGEEFRKLCDAYHCASQDKLEDAYTAIYEHVDEVTSDLAHAWQDAAKAAPQQQGAHALKFSVEGGGYNIEARGGIDAFCHLPDGEYVVIAATPAPAVVYQSQETDEWGVARGWVTHPTPEAFEARKREPNGYGYRTEFRILPMPNPAPASAEPMAKFRCLPTKGARIVELVPLAASAGLPDGEHLLVLGGAAMTEARIREMAETAALAVGKNAQVAPQLCFPHIYLTLKDAFPLAHAPASPPSASTI